MPLGQFRHYPKFSANILMNYDNLYHMICRNVLFKVLNGKKLINQSFDPHGFFVFSPFSP
jgi:hypothetical protein